MALRNNPLNSSSTPSPFDKADRKAHKNRYRLLLLEKKERGFFNKPGQTLVYVEKLWEISAPD